METKALLNKNIYMLCDQHKWNRRALAKKMGIMEASLSRSLNGNPTLETLVKIANALDVSVKSLFDDPDGIEGIVFVRGKVHRINSREELEKIVEASRPKRKFIISSISSADDD